MPKTATYYYCPQCPANESCSKASWDRAKVSGKSREACRQACIEHLVSSGRHYMKRPDATLFVDHYMQVEMWHTEESSDDDAGGPHPQPPTKVARNQGAWEDTTELYMAEIKGQIRNCIGIARMAGKTARNAEELSRKAADAFNADAVALEESHKHLQKMLDGLEASADTAASTSDSSGRVRTEVLS